MRQRTVALPPRDAFRDAWPFLAKYGSGHAAPRFVRPNCSDEIPAILRKAVAVGEIVVVAGGRSGVSGALVTSAADIVLDMTGLDRIIEIDEEACTVTVEAGILGGVLEERLSAQGFTCGHYPQSLAISTVGGWLSTRGTGTFSNKYGGIEDLVVGCEVVLADGEVARLGGAPRSAAGPRLLELFLGSEGTFGIVTRVTLCIFPLAEARRFDTWAMPSLAAGINASRTLFGRHAVPALLRLYDAAESRHLYARGETSGADPLLIVGHEGASQIVEAERAVATEVLQAHGGRLLGPAIGEAWNAGRYRADWLEDGNAFPGRIADSIEVAVAWPRLIPLYERVMVEIAPHATWSMAHLSHFYPVGGMFYFIFGINDSDDARLIERYRVIWRTVEYAALELGGTTTHHHGVGAVRADSFRRELGPAAHGMLIAIKRALDPRGVLNPAALGLSVGLLPRQCQD